MSPILIAATVGGAALLFVAFQRKPGSKSSTTQTSVSSTLADTLAEAFQLIEQVKKRSAAEALAKKLADGSAEKIISDWLSGLTPPNVPKDGSPS